MSDVFLTKKEILLDRYELDDPTCFEFWAGEEGSGIYLSLRPETLADMGNPRTITVTIEPGDRLNEGSG